MNEIDPTAFVHADAQLGDQNYIGPFCYVGPNVKIGSRNRFESHVAVGTPAEKSGFFSCYGDVLIGDGCIVREFVTIQGGTIRRTEMRDGCIMLRGSHLSHDSILEENVTVSCSALIGGESYVMRGANLGLGAILHQRTLIGSFAMLGMGAVLPKKKWVCPGEIWVGNPARFLKYNKIGMQKNRIPDDELCAEVDRWNELKEKYFKPEKEEEKHNGHKQ